MLLYALENVHLLLSPIIVLDVNSIKVEFFFFKSYLVPFVFLALLGSVHHLSCLLILSFINPLLKAVSNLSLVKVSLSYAFIATLAFPNLYLVLHLFAFEICGPQLILNKLEC